MDKYIKADSSLAELMGLNVVSVSSGVILTSRQCPVDPRETITEWVPRWCLNDAEAFALMVDHGVYHVENGSGSIVFPDLIKSIGSAAPCEIISKHQDKRTAVRYAIVQGVLAKLKSTMPTEDDFLEALGPCEK